MEGPLEGKEVGGDKNWAVVIPPRVSLIIDSDIGKEDQRNQVRVDEGYNDICVGTAVSQLS